jgi:hypothetical protein
LLVLVVEAVEAVVQTLLNKAQRVEVVEEEKLRGVFL